MKEFCEKFFIYRAFNIHQFYVYCFQNILDKGSLGGNGAGYDIDMKSVRKAVLVALKASAVQVKHVSQGM